MRTFAVIINITNRADISGKADSGETSANVAEFARIPSLAYKAFPIEVDQHLLTVRRYVERNPPRAHLVTQAEKWRWSSLSPREGDQPTLDPGPVRRGRQWLEFVNEAQTEAEVKQLRGCIQRGRPFGAESWMTKTASELGLEASLRPRGRPKKQPGTSPSLS